LTNSVSLTNLTKKKDKKDGPDEHAALEHIISQITAAFVESRK